MAMARDGSRNSAIASCRLAWRIAAALAVLMIANVAGWSLYASGRQTAQSANEKHDQDVAARDGELTENQNQPEPKEPPDPPARAVGVLERQISGGFELAGQVCNAEGQPLEQVTLLIIRKTWPGGKYCQQAFSESTDANGRFVLPEFLPADNQFAFLVAAVKEGFAIQSVYKLMKQSPVEAPEPVSLRLETSEPLTLIVRDAAGQPAANLEVIPSERTPKGGERQLVYGDGSEFVAKRTDDQGRVELNWFRAGDQAQVSLHYPDGDWKDREFTVTEAGAEIEISATDEPAQQTARPPGVTQFPERGWTVRTPFPVILLCVACAALGVFYFWLIIRVINRRERWAKRTAAALTLVALVLGYPASIGPAVWLASRGYISSASWENASQVYAPVNAALGYICKPLPQRAQIWVYYLSNNYVQIWLPQPSIQWPDFDQFDEVGE
jgi:hypothetical protein